jgi:hypothetical protein
MERRIYHGNLSPNDLARSLIGEYNRGNLRAQQIGDNNEIIVQIATRDRPTSGGQTALAVTLRSVSDGVAVEVGKQSWMGLAASLGQTAFWTLRSPWNLLDRLDDLAQDVEHLQLANEVWQVLDKTARAVGAGFELSERLRSAVCDYCMTANPIGEPACIACGAPLGLVQPRTCPDCGFVIKTVESTCPNCGKSL